MTQREKEAVILDTVRELFANNPQLMDALRACNYEPSDDTISRIGVAMYHTLENETLVRSFRAEYPRVIHIHQ